MFGFHLSSWLSRGALAAAADWLAQTAIRRHVAASAALEETLHRLNPDKQFASLKTDVPLIGDFREELKQP